MTIAEALLWAAERLADASPTARLDAELLLGHALGWSRVQMMAERRRTLGEAELAAFGALVERRAQLEPVAYITGHKEFYGMEFEVTPAVLVPRPETELLVDLALAEARRLGQLSLRAADVGTGSGCIAVALAAHWRPVHVVAVDISEAALAVARRNVRRYGLGERVECVLGDLLGPVEPPLDLLVSNPPYTVLSAIDENVRRHEPHLALDGGPDGLEPYRRLLAQAPRWLRPGGAVFVEIGDTQGAAVAALARAHFPNGHIAVHQDLAGLDRVVAMTQD